jgi:radical SAM protein with 4Fe4S-binding SPASM domain
VGDAELADVEPDRDGGDVERDRAGRAALWRENRVRLADDHLRRRVIATGRPTHLKLELTNYCNLACPMCPHAQMRREVGYMRPELFRRVVEQAAPELEFAYLHHLGESLFHGQIGELVRIGRASGAAMGLSTNATFLDERKGRALLESGLDFLVISLDGATPETYARVRVGAELDATAENVRRFLNARRELGAQTSVVVQLIVLPHNAHEVARFADEWRASGAQVMIKTARGWAGQVAVPGVDLEPVLRAPCKMLWTELTVLWDGAVVPCANFFEREQLVGDLSRQSLDEVWNGAAMQALRRAHLDDAVDGIRVCGTCPRHAFDHRDFVALDQLAQRRRNYLRDDLAPRPGLS